MVVVPLKVFGSGRTIVPSVPEISTTPWRVSGESKLKSDCDVAPRSKAASTEMVDGTSTGNVDPASAPTRISRSSRAFMPSAATAATGPRTLTRVVK